jgi:hypothetical protein
LNYKFYVMVPHLLSSLDFGTESSFISAYYFTF